VNVGTGDADECSPGEKARYWVLVDPQYGGTPSAANGEVARRSSASIRPYDFSPLPHSLAEGLAILSLAGEERCVIHQGADATEEQVKSGEMEGFERIHIAAHAHLNDEAPLLSALVLTQDEDPREDGFLTMREIHDLRLDADLVVLSSCETAAGKQYQGEGVVALARPFLAVGARSTIVSLWRVDDRSTASWMDGFYRSLIRDDSKERALVEARETMLGSKRLLWRLPYYWALFILVGDYR
jgi:CHAT domain-containing protein